MGQRLWDSLCVYMCVCIHKCVFIWVGGKECERLWVTAYLNTAQPSVKWNSLVDMLLYHIVALCFPTSVFPPVRPDQSHVQAYHVVVMDK